MAADNNSSGKTFTSDLTRAAVNWQEDGLPRSENFQDIYFSDDSAIAESCHVFIEGNNLPWRWQNLREKRFTVAECGFGSGLNLILCCQLWQKTAPAGATLHYLGFEKYPLAMADIRRLHQLWPSLNDLSEALLEQYPDHSSGVHRLHLGSPEKPVLLDLHYGDIHLCMDNISTRGLSINAWFLDGFAPAKNPDMWDQSLFRHLPVLSSEDATASTYSVASAVRSGFESAGFLCEKAPGFGRKRHMLKASRKQSTVSNLENPVKNPVPPWYQLPQHDAVSHIAVIGAGLAGSSTARALADKGFRVTVFERSDQVAAGASGNSQGIVYLKTARQLTPAALFMRQAYLYALHRYHQLNEQTGGAFQWNQCGLIQLAWNDAEHERFRDITERQLYACDLLRYVNSQQASELSGTELEYGGLHFPFGGWLSPAALCSTYLRHPQISLRLGSRVDALHWHKDHWSLDVKKSDADNSYRADADAVVVAGSHEAAALLQCREYPLLPVRGQLTQFAAGPRSRQLKTILCTKGYIIPADKGWHSIGGSFEAHQADAEPRSEDRRRNMGFLRQFSGNLYQECCQAEATRDRASIRSATPDHLPVIGPATDYAASRNKFDALRRDAGTRYQGEGCHHPGLWLNLAHGSHGITSTPLAAEYLASLIAGSPLPLQQSIVEALHPARYLIRSLKRQE